MGYMRHHAFVVTGWDREAVEAVWLEAKRLEADLGIKNLVSNLSPEVTNGYVSFFCVLPDGSKEGWQVSKKGDKLRDGLVEYLQGSLFYEGHDDDPPHFKVSWVEVQFGDDEMQTRIVRDSDSVKRDWYYGKNYDELKSLRSL